MSQEMLFYKVGPGKAKEMAKCSEIPRVLSLQEKYSTEPWSLLLEIGNNFSITHHKNHSNSQCKNVNKLN